MVETSFVKKWRNIQEKVEGKSGKLSYKKTIGKNFHLGRPYRSKILNTNDQASAEHTTTPPGKIL